MKPNQKRIDRGLWWDAGPMVVKGCTVVSPGCANCWAAGMEHRFKTGNTTRGGKWSGRVQTDIGALEKAVRGKPKVITIWNDLFHEQVPFEFIDLVFAWMALACDHQFLILSKRQGRALEWSRLSISKGYTRFRVHSAAQNLCALSKDHVRLHLLPPPEESEFLVSKKYWESIPVGASGMPWPLPNVWLGTSVETQDQIERVSYLLDAVAAKRFLSIEPMLGPVSLDRVDCSAWETKCIVNPLSGKILEDSDSEMVGADAERVDWVIVGAESGPKRRPCNIEWVRKVVQDCRDAGVPVWVKQIHDKNGKVVHKLGEFPEDLRLREWPE